MIGAILLILLAVILWASGLAILWRYGPHAGQPSFKEKAAMALWPLVMIALLVGGLIEAFVSLIALAVNWLRAALS